MDEIEFAPLEGSADYAQLLATLALPEAFLIEQELSQTGVLRAPFGMVFEVGAYTTQFGTLNAPLRPVGILSAVEGALLLADLPMPDFTAAAGLPTPSVSLLFAALPPAAFEATSYTVTFGTLDAHMDAPFGVIIGPEGGALLAALPQPAFGASSAAPGLGDNYAVITQSPGFIWSYGAWEFELLSDTTVVSDGSYAQYRARVVEVAIASVEHAVRVTATRSVSEGVSASDLLLFATRVAISEGVALTDTVTGFARALLRVYDAVLVSNPLATTAVITAAVSAGVVVSDAVRNLLPTHVSDGVMAVEGMTDRLTAVAAVLETLLASDLADNQVKVIARVTDTSTAADAPSSIATLIAQIREGVTLAMRMRFGGDNYTGWVVNTATRAVSTYTNYPFNSFAQVGNTPYGATDEGLFELTGEDDAGEQINATVRTVLTNLGTGRKKRMPNAYLGYTSGGALVLKVVTADRSDGERTEDWYKLTEQPAGTMREGRFTVGKGLASVYWAFELVNVGGADFEVDKIDLYPIILERRV